jgi:hypothetical protein
VSVIFGIDFDWLMPMPSRGVNGFSIQDDGVTGPFQPEMHIGNPIRSRAEFSTWLGDE